jgi:uncharacterized membrane protein YphA (DoxX/SURF4 family)
MKRPFTHYFPVIARILLGLIFFASGVVGILQLAPPPKTMPPGALDFFDAMARTHYMLQLVSGTQALSGALLLVNRFVPLALAFLAPVIVNIIAFHIFLSLSSIAPGIVVTLLEIYLVWSYRKVYAPMLAMRAKPGDAV